MPTADPLAARISWADLARRARVPAAVALAVVVAAVVLGGPAQTFLDALERAVTADPRWVLAAAAFEALSFAGYVALLSHVAGSRRFGLRQSYRTTLAGAAVTRLLPTAGAGGAALTLWVLKRSGREHAGRVLLTFLVVLYSVFLSAILVSGLLLALGMVGAGASELAVIPAAAAAAAMAVAVGLAVRPPQGDGRIRRGAATLGEAVRDALGLVRGGDPRLLGAVAWWGFDVAVLWSMLNAVGAAPPVGVLVLAYFLGQVANTIPVPGAASGGLVGVLLAFGVQADVALAGVLAYRAVAIWLPAPFGAHALAGLRRDGARWAAEDACAAPGSGGVAVRLPGVHAPQPLAA